MTLKQLWAYIREGFLGKRFAGGLFSRELIFKGAYYRNFTVFAASSPEVCWLEFSLLLAAVIWIGPWSSGLVVQKFVLQIFSLTLGI